MNLLVEYAIVWCFFPFLPICIESADTPGRRVEPASFLPIIRTFPLSNQILLTLRARGEVYLLPSPLLGVGSAGVKDLHVYI